MMTQGRALADYYEAAAAALPAHPKAVANWVMTEVLRELKERKAGIDQAPPPARLAALIGLVEAALLSSSAGKDVLAAIWDGDEEPAAAMRGLGLGQVGDRR